MHCSWKNSVWGRSSLSRPARAPAATFVPPQSVCEKAKIRTATVRKRLVLFREGCLIRGSCRLARSRDNRSLTVAALISAVVPVRAATVRERFAFEREGLPRREATASIRARLFHAALQAPSVRG